MILAILANEAAGGFSCSHCLIGSDSDLYLICLSAPVRGEVFCWNGECRSSRSKGKGGGDPNSGGQLFDRTVMESLIRQKCSDESSGSAIATGKGSSRNKNRSGGKQTGQRAGAGVVTTAKVGTSIVPVPLALTSRSDIEDAFRTDFTMLRHNSWLWQP